jgi:hypothetical protein
VKQIFRHRYALATKFQIIEMELTVPPSVFLRNLELITGSLGFEWATLPLVVYIQDDSNFTWKPIYPTVADAVLFPMLVEENEIVLTEPEYRVIGQRALTAYRTMADQCARHTDKLQDTVHEKMRLIEDIVAGNADMETLLALRYKQNESIKVCAFALHTANRTINRKLLEMAVHVGQTLHANLTSAALHELLDVTHHLR